MDEFVGKEIARIRQLVGEKGQVIGGYPRHMQGLHYSNFVQALYLGESTLRFVLYNELESRDLISVGGCQTGIYRYRRTLPCGPSK